VLSILLVDSSRGRTVRREKMSRYMRSTSKNKLFYRIPPIFISTSNHSLPGRRRGRRRPPAVGWSYLPMVASPACSPAGAIIIHQHIHDAKCNYSLIDKDQKASHHCRFLCKNAACALVFETFNKLNKRSLRKSELKRAFTVKTKCKFFYTSR